MENLIEEFKADNSGNREKLINQFRVGTALFYWIAGLSLAYAIVVLAGGDWWRFFTELGIPKFIAWEINAAIDVSSGAETAITFLSELLAAAVFILFGYLSRKGSQKALTTGISLYAIDGIMTFLSANLPGFVFHTLIFFGLVRGWQAYSKLEARCGNETFAGGIVTAEKTKALPLWLRLVIPALIILVPYWFIMATGLLTETVGTLLFLFTFIFVATAVLDWRRLKIYRRWLLAVLIGWQALMLALSAYLYLPDSYFGAVGRARTAEKFMTAFSNGDIETVMELLGREEADRVTYNVVARKFTGISHLPVSWELESRNGRDQSNGAATFANGQTYQIRINLNWSQQEARWIVTRVDIGGRNLYGLTNSTIDNSSLPFDIYVLDPYIDLRTVVELMTMLCLVLTAIIFIVDPFPFIETFRKRL